MEPGRGDRDDVLLRDTENHHGYGVHDADEDPGEPGSRIGEMSPVVGKVPRTPGHWHSQRAACAPQGRRRLRSSIPGAESLSVEADHGRSRSAGTRKPMSGRLI